MPFSEAKRGFDIAAQGGKCQTPIYNPETGYQICGTTTNLEDDHLTPESQLLFEGQEDPNKTEGIIRCQTHHTGRGMMVNDDGSEELAPYGHPNWSRHPDMGQARADYGNDHDSFRKAAGKHQEAVRRGERMTNDDEGVTEAERERVNIMTHAYCVENEVTPPVPKEHKKFERKSWTDIFFGTRGHEEDEA